MQKWCYCVLAICFIISCSKIPEIPTGKGNKVELETTLVSDITSSTAKCGGEVSADGGNAIFQRGVCWSVYNNPTTNDNTTSDGVGGGTYVSDLTSLIPNTKYFVRAYVINNMGTFYGNQVFFTTSAGLPTLTTTNASSIAQTSAKSGGTVSSDGGSSVIQRGVCWSTLTNPTISNSKIVTGSGIGSFTSSVSSLIASTKYYLRAFATNGVGTSYGNEISFTTSSAILPTITTTSISSILQTSAVSGGNITSDGGSAIIQKGVCWSTLSLPTISNSKTSDGIATGSFISTITALSPNTTYYLRAYATNSVGTSYGSQLSFKTSSYSIPTLSTSTITSVSQTSAIGGGSISSDGGTTVTQRGICWSTLSSPTISDSKIINSTGGIGSFTSTITGLALNTTYYVRAYATNSMGTAYGGNQSFTTLGLSAPSSLSPVTGTAPACCYLSFSWGGVSGATSYEINISKTSTFTGTVYTVATCGGSSYPSKTGYNKAIITSPSFCMNLGTSTYNGYWYWRVRAINGSVYGPWSSTNYYYYTY